MARPALVDAASVVLPPKVCRQLARVLEREVHRILDNNGTLDEDVVEAIRLIRLAASRYAAERVTTADVGISELPTSEIPSPWGHGQLLTTSQVADRLGCGERNVLDLRARGVLPAASRAGRSWLFDPVTVAEFKDSRAA